jgi:hypothetical protein
MSKMLIRTSALVEDCKNHLVESDASGTEIESYLTQFILIVLCADIQQTLYSIVETHATKSNDKKFANFANASKERLLRSVGKGDVAKFAGLFGAATESIFNENLDEKEISAYGAAVNNRHDVAHKSGVNVTFKEVTNALKIAIKMLEAFDKALTET